MRGKGPAAEVQDNKGRQSKGCISARGSQAFASGSDSAVLSSFSLLRSYPPPHTPLPKKPSLLQSGLIPDISIMKSKSGIADVIIIGGSHTGLSAALTLYRALHTCLIFDAGNPRNAVSDHVHMTPGFNDKSPNELREVARKELLATGLVQIVPRRVVSATKYSDESFEVVDAERQSWKGRKILLATGVEEKFPAIEGFAENYGKSM